MTCEPGRDPYTIRPANPADLPALQALAAACDVCRPGAHDPLWLAENAHGTPLGFIACTQVLDEMSLLSLAVHPAARRQGIARAQADFAAGERREDTDGEQDDADGQAVFFYPRQVAGEEGLLHEE